MNNKPFLKMGQMNDAFQNHEMSQPRYGPKWGKIFFPY